MLWIASVATALLLDRWLGEPQRWHPLMGFGYIASRLARRVNHGRYRRVRGMSAWLLLVLPLPLLVWALSRQVEEESVTGYVIMTGCLWFSIGWQSLREHGLSVAQAYDEQGLSAARSQVARMVSRDVDSMDEAAVARATIESLLENGSDAIIAPLFWFVLLGPAGALLYRLANTLDAMWGYRTDRWQGFGWCSARLDDVLNWLPARMTALLYALWGDKAQAWHCWRQQACHCASPNGGVVMCSGAGALGILLGGGAFYHGVWQARTVMGRGATATLVDIDRSVRLVDQAVYSAFALLLLYQVLYQVLYQMLYPL